MKFQTAVLAGVENVLHEEAGAEVTSASFHSNLQEICRSERYTCEAEMC